MGASSARKDKDAAGLRAEIATLRAELERIEAERDRLRESEKMYRVSAQIGGRLVWSANAEGELVAISPIFESVVGITEEEALRGGWIEAIHPDDRARFCERWAQSLRTAEPFSVEFRSLRPDRTTRMALARAVAAQDEQGRVACWYGLTEDIDEEREAEVARREVEARLRESEQLHRFTLELTQQIVWSVEPDGSGLTLSPRYYQVTGMDPADDPSLSIHPDDRERVLEAWTTSLESGRPYASECRLRSRSGDYRYYRQRAAPLRNLEGRVVRWYGVSEDIHEERLAEEAHRDAERRYRLAVQATNDAVWDYDVARNMLEWSDNSAAVLGLTDATLGNTSLDWWRDRLHPEDRDRVFASFRSAIESDQTHWTATYRFRRADGSYADMLDRGFIIRADDGKATRAVGAMADVTERNRAEAEIRRMQAELIHVSRLSAMGAMASTLAHEINQPLAAVSNFISGARRIAAAAPDPRPDLLAALEAAASGAHRAGEILRRLRELVSRGTVSVLVEDLPKLIEEASVLAFVDEAALGIRHRLELDSAARWVRADRIQIQQVLINLVRNAVDAMAGRPQREIVLSTRAQGEMVEIAVADTGAGIAPEHFDTLFSRFMTTKSGGMGIGLPISRTIVELHGGKIWAENRPEGGAVFRFTLPSARPAKQKRG